MKTLTPIGKDPFSSYYRINNKANWAENIILKEYICPNPKVIRTLSVFSKVMARKALRNNIERDHQRGVAAFSGIPPGDWPDYIGRIVLLRKIDMLPISCTISEEKIFFSNGSEVKFSQAVHILSDWLLDHGQYEVKSPAAFLLQARQKSLQVFDIIDEYLKSRKLRLASLKIKLGVELDEDTDEVIPIWAGEGVIPSTAEIIEAGEVIKDPKYLARKILPDSVFQKQIG